jgi:transposase
MARPTVDWDISQADDFSMRGVSWRSKGTLECGRAKRSDHKSRAERHPAGAAGCRGTRKTAAVMLLLGREDLETVSRGLGVTAATLTGWRNAFSPPGEAVLTTKPATGEDLESDRLKARLGAALIERDVLHGESNGSCVHPAARWGCSP